MSISVTVNGTSYTIPTDSETGWGTNVTNWIQAISAATLQKGGGSFTLTAEVDFGTSYGLKVPYLKSQGTNISSSGVLRLSNTEMIAWRNAANSGDLALGVNTSNQLTFGGNPIVGSSALTANRAVVTGTGGLLGVSATTDTEIGYVSGVTSSIQTQLNGKQATITQLPIANGGTGQATALAAFNALSPLTTIGDLLYGGASGSGTRLAGNTTTTKKFLTQTGDGTNSTAPAWNTIAATDVPAVNLSTSGAGGVTSTLPIGNGGTGQTSANNALNALLPSQTSASGKVLTSDGTNTSWAAPSAGVGVFGKNFLVNAAFDIWQNGTSLGCSNGSSVYGADQWYVKNSLGTSGNITHAQVTGSLSGSLYGYSVKISTAPTASQANGCELYQTLDNLTAQSLLGQTVSFSVNVKAQGNVNQVGIQFFYNTSEAKVSTTLGAETLTTVSSGSFTLCKCENVSVGTTPTSSGVVGVRIRITGVSTGNTYDLNNGFTVEQAQLNIGSQAITFQRRHPTEDIIACKRFFQKSFDLATAPVTGSGTVNGALGYNAVLAGVHTYGLSVQFPVIMRAVPTITFFNPTLTNNNWRNTVGTDSGAAATANVGQSGFVAQNPQVSGDAVGNQFNVHWQADARI